MVTRTAILDFKETGASTTQSRVVSLTDALEAQKRKVAEMSPVLRDHGASLKIVDSVAQSATAKIGSLTNSLGPLGAGLGAVAREAPRAAMGLLGYAAAGERASLMHKLLNTSILGGTSVMLAGAVAAAAYADNALRAADTYSTLHARIHTFTNGAIQAAQVERDIYKASIDARAPVADLTTLYTRLAPAVRDYGKSQQDALTITALVSKAQAIQGADIREQAAATIQFSQSIASGVMRGDELRSLLESAPQLLRYIAQNLEINGKVGVAFSQLRNLGQEGALSTDKIINALLRAQPQIEKDFINAPKTAQQYWQVLSDQIVRGVGQIAQASGAQKGVVDWLASLAKMADDFRQKMLLDPRALDPIKDAQRFIGGAVGTIGSLGKVAVEHFDDIVAAGQLIIALKLGEVFAGWFVTAAKGAQSAIGSMQAFRAAAGFQAGAALTPTLASAATGLRNSSMALDLRATEMQAAADIKAAEAAVTRTAADRALIQAQLARATVGAGSVAAAEAETLATNLNAAAKRAETAATKASAAAKTTLAAASARNAVATEAEAAVTVELTAAQMAGNLAKSAALGLYTLLGGAIGIASLALGALIYATWRSEEAYKAQVAAQRDAVVISSQLQAITTAMTGATWAQVPALQAAAQASRDKAAATLKQAEAEIKLLQAQQKALPGGRSAMAAAAMEREIEDKQGNVAAGRRDLSRQNLIVEAQRLVGLGKEAAQIQSQLSSGKDLAGRALSADQKSALDSRRGQLFTAGQQAVDHNDDFLKRTKAEMDRATGPKKAALAEGMKLIADTFNAATDLVTNADKVTATKPPSIKKPGKAGGGTAKDNSDDWLFRLSHGIQGDVDAKAKKISDANAAWQDLADEMNGTDRSAIQAQDRLNKLMADGADISKDSADAYLAFVAAREKGKRVAEALSKVEPLVNEAIRKQQDGRHDPTRFDAQNSLDRFDVVGALRQNADDMVKVEAAVAAKIRAELDRQVAEHEISRVEADKQASERILALRVAIETKSAEEVAQIWAKQRDDDYAEWKRLSDLRRGQEEQAADSIVGALRDLTFGADMGDVGKRLASDLLGAIYDELVFSPLRKAILDILRSTFNPTGTATGGLWGAVLSAAGSLFGGGGSNPAGIDASGGIRVAGGGFISCPGGPTDDKVRAKLSNGEFVVNARATRQNRGALEAMNANVDFGLRHFAAGGLVGGRHPRDYDDPSRPASAAAMASLANAGPAGHGGGRSGDVIIVNNTSTPVRATKHEQPDGSQRVELYEMFGRDMAQAAKTDPRVTKPVPRRRG